MAECNKFIELRHSTVGNATPTPYRQTRVSGLGKSVWVHKPGFGAGVAKPGFQTRAFGVV